MIIPSRFISSVCCCVSSHVKEPLRYFIPDQKTVDKIIQFKELPDVISVFFLKKNFVNYMIDHDIFFYPIIVDPVSVNHINSMMFLEPFEKTVNDNPIKIDISEEQELMLLLEL